MFARRTQAARAARVAGSCGRLLIGAINQDDWVADWCLPEPREVQVVELRAASCCHLCPQVHLYSLSLVTGSIHLTLVVASVPEVVLLRLGK